MKGRIGSTQTQVGRGTISSLAWLVLPIALLTAARAGADAPAPDLPAGPNPALLDHASTLAHPTAPTAPSAGRGKRVPVNAAHARGLVTVARKGSGVYYRKGFVLGVGVNVIEADLSNPEVRIAALVSRGGIGTAERFGAMVSRAHPVAAITGTFFGIRDHVPTGDLVINGQPIFRGFIGTAVAITEGNLVSFIPTRYKDRTVDWSLFDTVIRGGPRLVDAGAVSMTARGEGFRTLPVVQRRTRTAVGLNRDNHLQFVAVRQGITLWELAKVMRSLGAYHAVALDGGTSTAMYFAGRFVANPGRGLTNVLMIYDRHARYEAMRREFARPSRGDLASRKAPAARGRGAGTGAPGTEAARTAAPETKPANVGPADRATGPTPEPPRDRP